MLVRFIKKVFSSLKKQDSLVLSATDKDKVYMTKHQYNRLLLLQNNQFNNDFTKYRGKIIKIID